MKDLPAVAESPEALRPEDLSAALSPDGAYLRGVRRCAVWQGGWSVTYRLLLEWDRPTAAPLTVVLKVPRPDIPASVTARNARQEYRFYKELAHLTPRVPTLACYAGAHDDARGTYCLLLEDASATHAPPATKPVPPPDQARTAIEILGRLHASWWEDSRLGSTIGAPRPDAAALEQIRSNNQRAEAAFLAFIGDTLPDARRRELRAIAAYVPGLVARQAAGPATLVHGDAQWGNFMFPGDHGIDQRPESRRIAFEDSRDVGEAAPGLGVVGIEERADGQLDVRGEVAGHNAPIVPVCW